MSEDQTTAGLPSAEWDAPVWDGRPVIVGRNWWHWVQNLHTGNLWCAEWLDRDGAWGHPFSKGRPADVAKNWRYLGIALPPAEWVKMQKVIT